MDEDRLEETRKLSPDERIKKLREIAKKDEEEIKKAQDMIKRSEEEIENEERNKRQIPIPQLKSIDVGSLFGRGTQEEVMFKAKRYEDLRRAPKDAEDEKEHNLEKTVAKERESLSEETIKRVAEAEEAQRQYQLSMAEITNKAANIYDAARQSDYISSAQMRELSDMYSQFKEKMEDIRVGDYSPEYESFAAQKSAFSEIIKALKDKYHGR